MSARIRLLGDVVDDVIARLNRQVSGASSPSRSDPYRVPNASHQEWMFSCLQGKKPPEQKRLILQARHPSVGFLTDANAEILISALGLEDA